MSLIMGSQARTWPGLSARAYVTKIVTSGNPPASSATSFARIAIAADAGKVLR